ncbi:hypothetical protein [Mucilaginibacter sp.]|uniref:P-loop NTPase n=1 Tax=Mucilaginibacter sp. TaxID=1882438 RepID=UPI002611A4CD|nr:hypothetical protein [Mucilaginibacter sp.]MDB4919672.1 hypothetical protein [Mucilaginibacter sp.]
MNLELIKDDIQFEHFCKWIARDAYGPNVFLYQRKNQYGIDIYWTKKGKYYVIQSKLRREPNPSELIATLESDFKRAMDYFNSDLQLFIFATTASLEVISRKVHRQNNISESLIDVCNRLAKESKIEVVPWHWNYLQEKVSESPFLLKHLLKLEEGGELIDDEFVKSNWTKGRKNERQRKLEYYGGHEDVQWYGIFKNWDAPREIYNHFEYTVTTSFGHNEPVAFVIRGEGGSGKSVLLRRIAFNLRNHYPVYWIGSNLEAFIKNEFFYDVQRNPESNYVIILDDWYRNVERAENKSIVHKFLHELKKTSNARLIIGDRKYKRKIYDDFVLSKNIHDLHNTENTQLLANVLEQMPEWQKSVSSEELKDITNSTFFIALFVFCYNEEHNDENLKDRYKKIFKSDFSKLLERDEPFWKGIANSLYIYANLYSLYGITFTLETAVDLACHYSNCSIPIKYQADLNDLVKDPILKKYIHVEKVRTRTSGIINRIKFHHDTIAEQGWATDHELIDISFNEDTVDDLIAILKLIKRSIDLGIIYYRLLRLPGKKGKEMARDYLKTEKPDKNHVVFCACLELLSGEELSKEAARTFLETENSHLNKLAFRTSLDLLKGEACVKLAARKFLKSNNPHINSETFCKSLNLLKGEECAKNAAKTLLKIEKSYNYPGPFNASIALVKNEGIAKQIARDFLRISNPNENIGVFCSCLNMLKDEEPVKQIARNFLATNKAYENNEVFCACLNVLKYEGLAKRAARDFLATSKAYENSTVFCNCLNILGEEETAKQGARLFLKTNSPYENSSVFCSCLNVLKYEELAKQTARIFLSSSKAYENNSVFCACLNVIGDEELVKQVARDFLATSKPDKGGALFCSILKLLSKEEIGKQAARDFLETNESYYQSYIFCTCLSVLKGDKVAKKVAGEFLTRSNSYKNTRIFCSCLNLLKGEETAKRAARDFLQIDPPRFYPDVFCKCLLELGQEVEALTQKILQNHLLEDWIFVYTSLIILCQNKNLNNNIISSIVNDIIANKNKDNLKYCMLLEIPLFNDPNWLNEATFLINHWKEQTGFRRNYLYSVTKSHEEFPEKIKDMSINIVRNWKNEFINKTRHQAYFIRCLANINTTGDKKLVDEVIQICHDIINYQKSNSIQINFALQEWIRNIAIHGEFPIWKFH